MNENQQLNIYPNSFLIIPSYVADHPDLDEATVLLFGRLNSLSNSHGFCVASDEDLAHLCNCSKRHVQRHLKKLKDLELICICTEKNGLICDRKIWTYQNFHAMEKTDC